MDEKPDFLLDEHLKFLDEVRESGFINMFGARPYILEEFPNLSKEQAKQILLYWMRTFSERQNLNS